MRITLAACALMLALAVAVQGADKQSWGFVTSGDEVLLVYDVPESDKDLLCAASHSNPSRSMNRAARWNAAARCPLLVTRRRTVRR